MYTIGQVSEMFGLPISTLRYYDKQGLFPEMERVSGIRKFREPLNKSPSFSAERENRRLPLGSSDSVGK